MSDFVNVKDMKFNLEGLTQLQELNIFIDSQPSSIFDGLSSLSIIRLYILCQEKGFARFTTWMEQDMIGAQRAYRSVSTQKNFGRGGFVETFADLAFDPR